MSSPHHKLRAGEETLSSAQKMGKLTLDHVRSVVVITTKLLWSYVTDAISVSILNMLPPQEAPLYMEGFSFVKNVKEKLFMKALEIYWRTCIFTTSYGWASCQKIWTRSSRYLSFLGPSAPLKTNSKYRCLLPSCFPGSG